MTTTTEMPILLSDSVEITNACPDHRLHGIRAIVCTLPRDGHRLVRFSKGGGMQVVSVPENAIKLARSVDDKRREPIQAEPPHSYYKPTENEYKGGPELKATTRLKLKESKESKSGISNIFAIPGETQGEDFSEMETFRLCYEDAKSVWEFEKIATLKVLKKWKLEQMKGVATSSDQRTIVLSVADLLEFKDSGPQGVSEIPGRDGRYHIPVDILQKRLNNTARMLQTTKQGDQNALRAALLLAKTWVQVHKLKETADLLSTLTTSCLNHPNKTFHKAILMMMAYQKFKIGDFEAAEQLYRKLLGMIGKLDSSAIRENLAMCLLSKRTGKGVLEAEAVLMEALYGEIASKLDNIAKGVELGKPFKKASLLLLIAVCKYYRSSYDEAYTMAEEAALEFEAEVKEGYEEGPSFMLAKSLGWIAAIAKAQNMKVFAAEAKRKALGLLLSVRMEDLQLYSNIKDMVDVY
ncbi:hypothetical protein AAMO2058_000375600 [Amorphochlora amoebiformis]